MSMMKVPSPVLSFALLVASSALIGWRTIVGTFTLALGNDEYTHILLILPISVTLIVLEWPSVRQTIAPSAAAGAILLATALGLAGWTRVGWPSLPSHLQLSIRMFALVLSWIASFVLCFGSRTARALLFPLGFLYWLVPFPLALLNGIVRLLQQGSAWTASVLFTVAGVPVAQDGVILTIPGLMVEVAKECSSIRSSLMLLVTTMVLAQLLLKSPWRKAFIIAVAVPFSVAKNGLRIFTIAMLGTRVDPGFLTGRLHHQGGIIFFSIALVATFLLLWILRRTEHRSPVRPGPNPIVEPCTSKGAG